MALNSVTFSPIAIFTVSEIYPHITKVAVFYINDGVSHNHAKTPILT